MYETSKYAPVHIHHIVNSVSSDYVDNVIRLVLRQIYKTAPQSGLFLGAGEKTKIAVIGSIGEAAGAEESSQGTFNMLN